MPSTSNRIADALTQVERNQAIIKQDSLRPLCLRRVPTCMLCCRPFVPMIKSDAVCVDCLCN